MTVHQSGINGRLLVLGVLPAALTALVMLIYLVETRVVGLESALLERGTLIVRQLALASASALRSGNVKLLQDLTALLLKERDVVEVEVSNHAGRVATSKRAGVEVTAANQLVLTEAVASVPPADLADPFAASPVARNTIGNVRLVLSRQETRKQQYDTLIHAVLIGFGGLVVAVLLAYRLGRKIRAPIYSLTEAVHALSEGRLGTRLQCPADRELDYLQAGFNAMAAELQKRRQSLEQQVQDATEQLQCTLKSLEKRNEELEAARRSAEMHTALKSQFLAQMSHEIRTPMSGIIGFAELLAQTPLNEEQCEQLSLIERSAKNLLAISNEILDLAKLEAGKISLNMHQFLLRSYLEDAIALQIQRFPNLPVILWVAPEVPETVLGDPIRLQQIINNLLGNALKFTRQGRVVIRVRLQNHRLTPRLLFSVSDSGKGICPEDQTSLFLPFQQSSDYPLDRERGTGLGLSIAKNIVAQMGGHLRVASRPGRGTTFWFDLPITQASSDEPLLPTHPHCVVIDADKLRGEALRYQLEGLGALASTFSCWEDFVRANPPLPLGAPIFFHVRTTRGQPEISLTYWVERAVRMGARPIFILPPSEKDLGKFFRDAGTTCLLEPVRAERLHALLRRSVDDDSKRVACQPHARPDLRGRKILIAEDNEINRILLSTQLTGMGASVESVQDGLEALAASRRTPYDLIVLDLQMPKMDGLSVMRELKATGSVNPATPVIAITAHVQPSQREEIRAAGFADCLIKPILEQQLAKLIRGHLGAPGDRAVPCSPESHAHVTALLEKTAWNRELALSIGHKLFTELPQQLAELNDALTVQDFQAARDVTHKIHGSSAFCGLQDIRQAAGKLESLLDTDPVSGDLDAATRALASSIQGFLALESMILEALKTG